MRSLPHDPRKLAVGLAAAYCASSLALGYLCVRLGIGVEQRRVDFLSLSESKSTRGDG